MKNAFVFAFFEVSRGENDEKDYFFKRFRFINDERVCPLHIVRFG
jgi:hypothetical protein